MPESALPCWLLRGRPLLPVVQGGMGIGLSAHRLAGHVARLGALGTISSVELRHHHPDLASSARSVADAISLARAEAIRTGSNHIVAFDIESGLAGIDSDIVVVNDGPPATANCVIDAGEIVHRIPLEQGVSFGSDPGR